MIGNHSRSSKRSAFTLVELLVVILIIAILVSLIGSAVMKAMGKIPEVQTRTELSEMDVALQGFMSDHNLSEPPPSLLILREDLSYPAHFADPGTGPIELRSFQFLQKVFSKNLTPPIDWNGDGSIDGPWTLQGQQCLVFYLGGIPNSGQMISAPGTAPNPQGFSTSNINPAAASVKRQGPYFTFVTTRLWPQPQQVTAGWNGFFMYLDPWQTKSSPFFLSLGGTPYAFFSSAGNNNGYSPTDCSGLSYNDASGAHFAMPYWIGAGSFTNSNTYQILSAGKDGMYGYNPSFPQPNNLWSPSIGAIGTGADDQAHFSGSLLGSGQS